MTYKILSSEHQGFAFHQFEIPMSTIALLDLDAKTYDTMSVCEFLENNEETFTPYETIDLIATIFMGETYDFSPGMGMNYRVVLFDLCVHNPDEFEFVDIEHEVDHFEGFTLKF